MWRLRRRAAGRRTGPYAGAAVGAMFGPYRRRASGDAAVARVVVCTDARPLVHILMRGGVRGFGHGIIACTVSVVIHVPAPWCTWMRGGVVLAMALLPTESAL